MTLNSVTTGLITHLRAWLGTTVPVFPQDQMIDTSEVVQYVKVTIRRADQYTGVGGDIMERYIIILTVFMQTPTDPNIDGVSQFDQFVQWVLDAVQNRNALDLLLQRSKLHLDKGVTDMQDHPFSRLEPGHFQKIITMRGHTFR